MSPDKLKQYLKRLIEKDLKISAMIWGAPGIGKSSVVQQVATETDSEFIDLRLSQLAPTDLRGLPVPKSEMSTWLPPEFLPRSGKGILFLDEINMAPPVMQGVAQQLILDRKVGSYTLPEDWHIWAAGNRKEDRASVYDMPAPLSNRFIHLEVEISLPAFKQYAYHAKINEQIIGFISFKQNLLHKMDKNSSAWPSPRSWEMSSHLLAAKLDISPAIGEAAALEFNAYVEIAEQLPDIQKIIEGKEHPPFPPEPSLRYAIVTSVVTHCKSPDEGLNGFKWLIDVADAEWVQLFVTDLFSVFSQNGQLQPLQKKMISDNKCQPFLSDYMRLLH